VNGHVIGINSMIAGGLGLAVPSNAVQRFLGAGGVRPRLGVIMQPVVIPAGRGATEDGLLVLEVAPDSPAERAGITVGDIVVGANGNRFRGPHALPEAIDAAARGNALMLDLVRGGVRASVSISLAEVGAVHSGEAA
jgi:serine protease Do